MLALPIMTPTRSAPAMPDQMILDLMILDLMILDLTILHLVALDLVILTNHPSALTP